MLSSADTLQHDPLKRGISVIWHSLPVFLLPGIAVAATWSIARTSPLLVWPALLIVLALLTAMAWGFAALMRGDAFRLRELCASVPRAVTMTLRLLGPVVLSLALATIAFHATFISGQEWMLLSGGAGLALTSALAAIGLLATMVAAARTVTARQAWRRALHLLMRRPVAGVGVVAGFVLAGWATLHLSFALLILLPIPLVAIWVAAHAHATASDQG